MIGLNSWNGPYESYKQDDENLIYAKQLYPSGTFTHTVKNWMEQGDLFENIPGLWNHHPAGFAAGFGGLKKTRYYFDVHLGRLIDDTYLTEALFGCVATNDYSILFKEADYPASRYPSSSDLTQTQYDPNTWVGENA